MLNGIMGTADTVQKILELDLLESSSRKREHTIDTDLTGQMEVQKYKKNTFLKT